MAILEERVVGHLSETLQTEHVYAERPVNPPAEYYIIEKTAADEENHVLMATIAVQSISGISLLRAAQMSHDAENAMREFANAENVGRCKLNSAYNFTDTETKEYRYQAVFDIHYMEGD